MRAMAQYKSWFRKACGDTLLLRQAERHYNRMLQLRHFRRIQVLAGIELGKSFPLLKTRPSILWKFDDVPVMCWCANEQRSAAVYRDVRKRVCKKFVTMIPAEQRNAMFIYDRAQKGIRKGNLRRMRIMWRQIVKQVWILSCS